MSEKKWSCKWTGSGRRGRTHKGKEYPRHALKYFEGEHMGMRKRIYSKSHAGSVWREGRAALSSKYIIGLLNKFVGKTYEDFKFVYDQKTKNLFKKYDLRWGELKDYLHNEPKSDYWHESFYVDDKGFIRKVPQKARHRRTLTKRQWEFNKRVKLPDFGQCREDPRYAVKMRFGTSYEETQPHEVTRNTWQPKLLGEFWVNYDKRIFKIPVWTCNSEVMMEYHRYNGYDWVKGKRVWRPFKSTQHYYKDDPEWTKKATKAENEWIPISVWGLIGGQSHVIRLPNYKRLDLIKDTEYKMKLLAKETDPLNIERLQKAIDSNTDKVEDMPEKELYNMGYGKFYTFMKRSDYEQFLQRIKGETA